MLGVATAAVAVAIAVGAAGAVAVAGQRSVNSSGGESLSAGG